MKIFAAFLGLISLVFLVVAIVLGVLLIQSNNQISKLKADLEAMGVETDLKSDDVIPEEDTDSETVEPMTFVDTGLDINIDYPSDWEFELDTEVSDDFVDSAFKSIQTYNLTFSKGGSEILFSAFFGATGDLGVGYSEDEYDVVVLNDEMIRVRQNGQDSWKYVYNVDCADVLDLQPGVTVCGTGGFFPGFSNQGANTASFTTDSDALLEEADAIILSATL